MKITLVLAEPEERHVVDFDARDRRAFERVGGRDIGLSGPAIIGGEPRMPESQLAWIGWHAAHRQGLFDLTWPQFEARCAEASAELDAAEEPSGLGDPTGPAT
jgi:hypothetical protein